MEEPNVYRFVELVLDVPNRRLTRRGVEIYLPPKTFETLLGVLTPKSMSD